MHVSVQKFTRTTRPRSPAGSRGSEFSHPVAPSSEGMCTVESISLRERRPDQQVEDTHVRHRVTTACELTPDRSHVRAVAGEVAPVAADESERTLPEGSLGSDAVAL